MDKDNLEAAISGAHAICNERLVFETIEMDERDIRSFLHQNKITNKIVQGRYLKYLEMYRGVMGE